MPLDTQNRDVKIIKTKGQDLYVYPDDSINRLLEMLNEKN